MTGKDWETFEIFVNLWGACCKRCLPLTGKWRGCGTLWEMARTTIWIPKKWMEWRSSADDFCQHFQLLFDQSYSTAIINPLFSLTPVTFKNKSSELIFWLSTTFYQQKSKTTSRNRELWLLETFQDSYEKVRSLVMARVWNSEKTK